MYSFWCLSRQILAKTLTDLHAAGEDVPYYQPVHCFVLNPKSVTMGELYGEINKLTLEWQDGLMGLTVRHATTVSTYVPYWKHIGGVVA